MVTNESGWWFIYPSEKYESQWEGWHPIFIMENKKCLKPPTRSACENGHFLRTSSLFIFSKDSIASRTQQELLSTYIYILLLLCTSKIHSCPSLNSWSILYFALILPFFSSPYNSPRHCVSQNGRLGREWVTRSRYATPPRGLACARPQRSHISAVPLSFGPKARTRQFPAERHCCKELHLSSFN